MASNHGEANQTKRQQASSDHESAAEAREHSQTLPLITEEIAASYAAPHAETTPTEHVTTPVMPPNPIRREEQAAQVPSATSGRARLPESQRDAGEGNRTESNSEAAETKAGDGEEKKSEGRISATQLLAGAGAAATSSVIGGQLGVAGTVIGAGLASIITGLAVTFYSRSLDKGKEKIKEVGSKLAPAVKAQIAPKGRGHTDQAAGQPEQTTALRASGEAGTHAADAVGSTDSAAADADSAAEGEERTWWQKLRRKRVLYPVGIAVAAFGIGLGGVVMAESFTHADISPGTSQISRAVSGESTTTDDSGTTDGSHSGDSSSGSDSSGSQSGGDRTGTNDGSQSGGSASGSDSTSTGTADGTQTDQGTSTGTDDATGTDATEGSSGSASTDGTQAGSDSSGSDSGSTGSSDSSSGSSGSGTSSSGSGSNGSGSGSGASGNGAGGSGSGSGGSGSSGGSAGSAASAQG